MAITAPIGYRNRLVSLAELRSRHEAKMHPEFARRLFAFIEASGGLVGIGGGWRSSDQTVVEAGDRPWSLIGRLRPGVGPGSCLSRFHELNGGEHRVGPVTSSSSATPPAGSRRHSEPREYAGSLRSSAGNFDRFRHRPVVLSRPPQGRA